MAEANRERAMELFEKKTWENNRARIEESHKPFDPNRKLRCCDCQRWIPKKRLKVQPFACRCVQCSDAIERNRFV